MAQVKVVLLDWYGTLSSSKLWEHWADDPGERGRHFARIQELWLGEWSGFISDWCRGLYTTEEAVARFAAELQIPEALLMEELVHSCGRMVLQDPEVLGLVRTLREQGVLVGIATDNMDILPRWLSPAFDLDSHFDFVLNSYELRALKGDADPDGKALFFHDFMRDRGLGPGEVVLIDDSHSVAEVARWAGIDYRLMPFGQGLVQELRSLIKDREVVPTPLP